MLLGTANIRTCTFEPYILAKSDVLNNIRNVAVVHCADCTIMRDCHRILYRQVALHAMVRMWLLREISVDGTIYTKMSR